MKGASQRARPPAATPVRPALTHPQTLAAHPLSDDGAPSAPPLPVDGAASAPARTAGRVSVDEGERRAEGARARALPPAAGAGRRPPPRRRPGLDAGSRRRAAAVERRPPWPSTLTPTPPPVPRRPSSADVSLYRDLLRKARGDTALAGRWLAEIGATAPLAGSAAAAPSDAGDLDAAAAEAGAPPTFFCPISLKLMRDPVLLATGQSFDRPFLERWLRASARAGAPARCPATGAPLPTPVAVVPNVALRQSIETWAERHAIWLLGDDGHLRPVPDDDDFSRSPPRDAAGGVRDPDLEVALRMQEAELARLRGGGGRGGPAAPWPAAAAPGPPFLPPPPQPRPRPRGTGCLPTLSLYALSGAVLGAYLAALSKNGWDLEALSVNPLAGPAPSALLAVGALDAAAVNGKSQAWRVASSPFVVAGAVDLVASTTLAWALARPLARGLAAPWLSIPAIYVASGVVGACASASLLPGAGPQVGAPAAVAGLWGAALALLAARRSLYARRWVTAAVLLVLVGGPLTVLCILPYTNVFFVGAAAAVGALSGVALAAGPGTGLPGGRARKRWRGAVARSAACLGLAAAAAAAGASVGARPGAAGARCGSACVKAACVPSPWWTCDPSAATAPGAPPCAAHAERGGTRVLCRVGGSKWVGSTFEAGKADVGALCAAACPAAAARGGGARAPAPAPGAQPPPPPAPKPGGDAAADPSKGVLI